MTLRFRLNLLISLVFLLIILLGIGLVIHNARNAVARETHSTANLALQLLTVALVNTPINDQAKLQTTLTTQLQKLTDTRHLRIAVTRGEGGSFRPLADSSWHDSAQTPAWFSRLIEPRPIEYRRVLTIPEASDLRIVVRADPADEITEVWYEARILLGLLLAFAVLANGLVYIATSRALRPLDQVLEGLEIIESGRYDTRLPRFPQPEMDLLARKFNHVATVLQQGQRENHYLAQQTLEIQEQERRRFAHELHDELGQSTSAIKALALAIGKQTPDPTADNASAIQKTAHSIATICTEVHGVIRGMLGRLRPVTLDELGLVAALRQLTEDWNTHHQDTVCSFRAEGDFTDLSDSLSIGIYRIVQECLTNCAKHAQAARLAISLQVERNEMRLEVEDDGVGFDVNNQNPGLGLIGMRERAQAGGGDFALHTHQGTGVRLIFTFPLQPMPILTYASGDNHATADRHTSPAGR